MYPVGLANIKISIAYYAQKSLRSMESTFNFIGGPLIMTPGSENADTMQMLHGKRLLPES